MPVLPMASGGQHSLPTPCWKRFSVCLWQATMHCSQSSFALGAGQAAPVEGDSDEHLMPVVSGDVTAGSREHI